MAAAEPKLLSSDIEHLTEKQVRGLVRAEGQAGEGQAGRALKPLSGARQIPGGGFVGEDGAWH